MPRPLKVFQAHIGFYDVVVAAQSMKAAAEAFGAKITTFKDGFAGETKEPKAVRAALAQPGVLLKRPFGQGGDFKLEPDLPEAPKLTAKQKKAVADMRQTQRHREDQERKRKVEAERKAKEAVKQELAELDREQAALEQRRRKLREKLR